MEDRQKQAKILRNFRKIHRITGALLFSVFFFIAITGLLLGWKKNSGGYIMVKDIKGTSFELDEWKPIGDLQNQAFKILEDSLGVEYSKDLNRIDIRPQKGLVKFVFNDHFHAIHLDGKTGKLLQIEKRRADFIEKIHDGSLIDQLFGIPGDIFKLVYTSVAGIALLIFTITGFWLWYGPKRMRSKSGV